MKVKDKINETKEQLNRSIDLYEMDAEVKTVSTNTSSQHIYTNLNFDGNTTGQVAILIKNNILHFKFNTNNPDAHKNGKDGAYYLKFLSPHTKITGWLYEEGHLCACPYYDSSINLGVLLPFNRHYDFVVEPDDKSKLVAISAEIFYSSSVVIPVENIDEKTESVTVKVSDKKILKFSDLSQSCSDSLWWESSNPSVVSINFRSGEVFAHNSGKVIITVTNGCGFYHTFEVKSVIDYVDILPDGRGFNKVVFRSTGKVWHCVYCDSIFANSIADSTKRRNNLNYYVNCDDKTTEPLSADIKFYTNEELRLLYSIDPLGVANYIHRFTGNLATVDVMNIKDKYFELFFGRKPLYFARNIQREWVRVPKPEGKDLEAALSESELIMGQHAVWDDIAWLDLISATIDFVIDVIFLNPIIDDFVASHKTLNAITTIYAFYTCESFEDLLYTTTGYVLGTMYENTSLKWAFKLIDTFSSLNGFFNSIDFDNTLYRQMFDYCIGDYSYEVYINPASGKAYKLNDYKKYALNS